MIDLLFFREIGQATCSGRRFGPRLLLGAVFGLLFAGALYANLLIARRLRPDVIPVTPDQEVLERVRDVSDPFLRWLVPLGASRLRRRRRVRRILGMVRPSCCGGTAPTSPST